MVMSSFIVYGVVTGLGILVGYHLRNTYAEKIERATLESVDQEIRNRLVVAENLNKSLLADVTFLRKKVAVLTAKETA